MTREERKRTIRGAEAIGRAKARTVLRALIGTLIEEERDHLFRNIHYVDQTAREHAKKLVEGMAQARLRVEIALAALEGT